MRDDTPTPDTCILLSPPSNHNPNRKKIRCLSYTCTCSLIRWANRLFSGSFSLSSMCVGGEIYINTRTHCTPSPSLSLLLLNIVQIWRSWWWQKVPDRKIKKRQEDDMKRIERAIVMKISNVSCHAIVYSKKRLNSLLWQRIFINRQFTFTCAHSRNCSCWVMIQGDRLKQTDDRQTLLLMDCVYFSQGPELGYCCCDRLVDCTIVSFRDVSHLSNWW